MLTVQNLTYRIAGRILLEDASFALDSGHKAALIGRNGSGKSTLFGLLAGDLQPDGGEIRLQKGVRLGRVAQEAPAGPESLIETVLRADEERGALLAEAETAEDGHRIAEIHTRLADIEAEKAPARAARILAGLGFDEETQQRPCQDFSGGWRMRVALAAALFARPDLLLLDEPTNHLDLEAAIWLEDYLASWPGTLLVISHDRRLLDTIPEEILHLDDRKVTRYVGNYTRFERTRAERQMQQARLAEKQAAERKHIQAFVDRFRAKATKARQAQSRLKMLARMEPIVQVREEAGHEFRFPQPDQLPPPIVAMDNVAVGYEPDKPVLSRLGLRIDMDDRIGLLGANGNGKSTLVKLLAGRLAPQSGQMTVPPKLRVGYFAQHQQEELHLEESAFQQVRRLMPDASETQVRSHLGGFAFSGQSADQAVGSMSGGEKARLLFAMMSLGAPHLMLLDEPTNHLDVDAREALIRALNDYDGAVVLVSHDPHLLELVCDRLWLVRDGSCKPYDGDLDDYRKLLQEERRDRRRRAADERAEADGGDKLSKKDARRARAQNRERTQELRRRIKDAERDIEKLTGKREALEAKLADPAVYDGSTRDLMDLQVKHAELKQRVDDAEARWLEAQAALEELEQAGDSAA